MHRIYTIAQTIKVERVVLNALAVDAHNRSTGAKFGNGSLLEKHQSLSDLAVFSFTSIQP